MELDIINDDCLDVLSLYTIRQMGQYVANDVEEGEDCGSCLVAE